MTASRCGIRSSAVLQPSLMTHWQWLTIPMTHFSIYGKALNLGYKDADGLMADANLNNLHPNPKFQQLVAELKRAPTTQPPIVGKAVEASSDVAPGQRCLSEPKARDDKIDNCAISLIWRDMCLGAYNARGNI